MSEVVVEQVGFEFFEQAQLPCPVKGCNWVGQQLGNHAYFAHGICAHEFKKLMGVSTRIGLVCKPLRDKFRERDLPQAQTFQAYVDPEVRQLAIRRKGRYVPSLKRAASKRRHIRHRCEQCGIEFAAPSAKFCSRACIRKAWEKKQPKEKLACVICGNDFLASYRYPSKAPALVCSNVCRGKLNGGRPKPRSK